MNEAEGDSWLFAEQADRYAARLQALVDAKLKYADFQLPEPSRPCATCATGCGAHREQRFWRSIFGPHLICAICHPPATDEVVADGNAVEM